MYHSYFRLVKFIQSILRFCNIQIALNSTPDTHTLYQLVVAFVVVRACCSTVYPLWRFVTLCTDLRAADPANHGNKVHDTCAVLLLRAETPGMHAATANQYMHADTANSIAILYI
jgi:hypothetical protein